MIFHRYIINPYMSEGGISNYKKRQFSLDLQRILVLITGWLKENERSISNAPTIFEAAPIATSFSIANLFKGVRDIHLTKGEKYEVTNIIHSSISNRKGGPISGNDVISNYDKIIKSVKKAQFHLFYQRLIELADLQRRFDDERIDISGLTFRTLMEESAKVVIDKGVQIFGKSLKKLK